MTGLDWLIAGATLLFAVSGYLRGFIVGALSLAGFIAGAIVGTRVADALLPAGRSSPYAPIFGLFGALTAGVILATGIGGLGMRLRRGLRVPGLGLLDGVLGALLSAAVALGIAWVLGVMALSVPGGASLRGAVERSAILRRLDELMPPSGVVLNALARIDPLPSVGVPIAPVAPPPGSPSRISIARSAGSVVRVVGTACGLGVEGSGWVVAPGEVLTNAHVVAGEHDTVVEVAGDPPDLGASVILFDPHNDLALLRVSGLTLPPLRLAASPAAGAAGVILGYPLDGAFDAQSARIGETQDVEAQNAYGQGPVTRRLVPIRGLIRPGNSGGPIVDSAGRVLATVFAATTGGGPRGGYGVANSTVSADLARARGPVSTEGCAG
jgi:S1-C subfamily serine protease